MLIADLERLAAADAPDLAEVVKAFVEQDDPRSDTPAREGALSFDWDDELLAKTVFPERAPPA